MKVFEDHALRCMHSVHSRSSSRCFPQFKVPAFMVRALAPDAIRHFVWLRKIAGGDNSDRTKTVSLVTPSESHEALYRAKSPAPYAVSRTGGTE
jgi:hypothetical protein